MYFWKIGLNINNRDCKETQKLIYLIATPSKYIAKFLQIKVQNFPIYKQKKSWINFKRIWNNQQSLYLKTKSPNPEYTDGEIV